MLFPPQPPQRAPRNGVPLGSGGRVGNFGALAGSLVLAVFAASASACASGSQRGTAASASSGASGTDGGAVASAAPVAAASPPKDDGEPAQGGQGGHEHAAALEELKVARLDWRADRQNSLRVLLPDARAWLRVKFWGVKSLVGFRYGKDHHAIVGGFIIHVPNEKEPEACGKAFEAWAQPYVDAFEVEIVHDAPRAVPWNGKIVDIDSLVASSATLGAREQYAATYATYPAWPGACLIVGIAIPARDELERAKAVRDRFASEVLPVLRLGSQTEPKEMY